MIGVRKIMIIIDIMNIMNIMILHERIGEERSLLAKCLNSRIDRAISAPCHHAPPPSITKYKYRRKSMLCVCEDLYFRLNMYLFVFVIVPQIYADSNNLQS